MFTIEIHYPAGIVYASGDGASQAEWPPHPSRLFSALVSAAHVSPDVALDGALSALQWLERQDPPLIDCPEADCSSTPISYVPTADINSNPQKAQHPIVRSRQPRYFPAAAILGEPTVRYSWSSQPAPQHQATLVELAARLTVVGTSHAFVVGRAYVNAPSTARYRPSPLGDCFLRVPVAGRLAELQALAGRSSFIVRRPPARYEPLVGYIRVDKDLALRLYRAVHRLVLPGCQLRVCQAELVAASLRRAVMSQLPEPIPPAVHGHGNDGTRVAWLPLANIGHDHANGRILGMAIAIPTAMPEEDEQSLLMALGAVTQCGLRITTSLELPVSLLDEHGRRLRSLQLPTWGMGGQASQEWASVTPVVLDRPPKKFNQQSIASAIADSVERVGFPRPLVLGCGNYSLFNGGPSIHEIPGKVPRFHAHLRFDEPVQGPVIAGRLRNRGIGFFRPWRGSADEL